MTITSRFHGARQLAASAAAVCGLALAVHAQGQAPQPLPLSPTLRDAGQSVTGAYDGWYKNDDGTYTLLVGYYNRNLKEALDIPVGPNNRIEPGGPDMGQPTHFDPSRQFGVFTIRVPADFGQKQLMWTLTSNGQTNVITLHLRPDYIVEPFLDAGSHNKPPVITLASGGTFTGPPIGIAADFTANVGEPLPLVLYLKDEGPSINAGEAGPTQRAGSASDAFVSPRDLSVTWSRFRGPGAVTFDPRKPPVAKALGQSSTAATFAAPGEYILRAQANDSSGDGGGGFECCWSNVLVRVTVK